MILTPEERRAVATLAMLLAFGQAAAWWEKRESAKPDAELSAWLSHIAEIRADSASQGAEGDSASFARPSVTNIASALGASSDPPEHGPQEIEPAKPERPPVVFHGSKEIPPGILETGKLRINDATAKQLEALPGIGPSLAQRILAARRERPFSSVEDLRRVSGIGPKTLERLRPQIDVSPPRSSPSGDTPES
jgi:competence protein ComEA